MKLTFRSSSQKRSIKNNKVRRKQSKIYSNTHKSIPKNNTIPNQNQKILNLKKKDNLKIHNKQNWRKLD